VCSSSSAVAAAASRIDPWSLRCAHQVTCSLSCMVRGEHTNWAAGAALHTPHASLVPAR
jgi:hypothetical protein